MRLVKAFLLAAVLAAVLAPDALAFRFSDHTRNMPVGVVGQPFSHPVETVAGCKGVYITVGPGSLPPGLQLVGDKRDDVDGSNWRIEGTPTQAGSYSFWLVAKNLCPIDSTEEEFTITVVGGSSAPPPPPPPAPPPTPPVVIEQSSVPTAVTGQSYSTRLTARGGSGSQRWSLAGGILPSGLALAGDGTLGGTPQVAGDYRFTAKVEAGGASGSREFTLAVRDPLTASIQAAKQAEVGVALRVAPAVAGGVGPYRWTVASGSLPAGVGLDEATGALSGTAEAAGTFPLALRVTDREGRSIDVRIDLTVQPRLAIASGSMRFARGAWASRTIETIGGVGKKRFKVVEGRLPLGLRLSVNGVLAGTPRAVGRFRVVVQVTDGYKVVATRALLVTVVQPRR